jgi:hypothetical protein
MLPDSFLKKGITWVLLIAYNMDDIFTNSNFTTASEISVYQLVNALSDAAFICDHTGRIIVCSNEVLSFFNINDKSKVIDSNFQSYIAYEHVDEAYFLLLSVVNEANSRKSGKFLIKKGLKGVFYANLVFTSIVSEDSFEKYVLVTFRETQLPDTGIQLIHKKDIRLSRLCETLISQSSQPTNRIQKLLSQIGETLGAVTCSYIKLENSKMYPYSFWESPFNAGISPQIISRQLFDYLTEQNEKLVLIRKPLLSTFLESEYAYKEDAGVKAVLGTLIMKNNAVE